MKQNEIVVLGAGESGVGAAILAKKLNLSVFVTDSGKISELNKTELNSHDIEWEENGHNKERILDAALVVKSPGVPEKIDLIKKLRINNVTIISEIEFASRYTTAKIIGITGSNGKTTTTMLTFHLLKAAKINVEIGGNIGNSFARLIANNLDKKNEKQPIYVLEISSFQLDDIQNFRPDISIMLNITPDHLDRYEYVFDNYVRAKFLITKNQTENDVFIVNEEDTAIQNYISKNTILATKNFIRKKNITENSVKVGNNIFNLEKTQLKGPHNFFNAACALQAALLVGADEDLLQEGLETFQTPEHRLEFVTSINGIDFINDSKATNVDSVFWALSAMKKPTILILGGVDKGNDYSQIESLVGEKVKTIVAMGTDNSKIINFFNKKITNFFDTQTIQLALDAAFSVANPGDVILLSPACASFDLFKNYEDRGQQFKRLVNQLKEN